MDIKNLSVMIKSIIESIEGCYTTTTEKKGLGFVPKNKWNIKWGQIDVNDQKIRIVLDTMPGKYTRELIENILDIPEKHKGSKKTGYFIKKTDKSIPFYDAIEISIYHDYQKNIPTKELLEFIKTCARESSFKTKAS
ncbi:hypothetical protein [Cytobacillus firmus]|uniref:hypothetical protein n=1 Tax=Cytobacillus firmus TaxID=1399 RepID=UPI001CFE0BBE|nr:hypothetical protein [Cytobacillus firmus]